MNAFSAYFHILMLEYGSKTDLHATASAFLGGHIAETI